MTAFSPPETFNMADYFLDERIREGRGERTALLTDSGAISYQQVRDLSNRFGNLLRETGVDPEQRVMIALPDGPEYVGALFGALKIGAAAVMVNPDLRPEEIAYLYEYTRPVTLVTHVDCAAAFRAAAGPGTVAAAATGPAAGTGFPRTLLVAGGPSFGARLAATSPGLDNFPTHRDDAAIWLFSGGTTGRPKAVVQTHTSYANTTECYAKGVIQYAEDDITLSVPKLYFGYATGSNLLFPFSAGASSILFPERCTAEVLFEKIERLRPTILVNVPTMIRHMLAHPGAKDRDLSSLRLATSAGEALPAELHREWDETFGVELLDGLGTAEMWHIFLSNRPGDVRPGTLGRAVPGFEVRVCDENGHELPAGETGWLWVRGNSRAVGYWQRPEQTRTAFRGEWYVSGDMVRQDEEGYITYCGRGDDMLKVSGKWLAPKEVEDCLLAHPAVREAVVVGTPTADGLVKPCAVVVPAAVPFRSEGGPPASEDESARGEDRSSHGGDDTLEADDGPPLEAELQDWVRERLAPYKYPRRVLFVDDLPRTHLGKVNRGAVRERAERALGAGGASGARRASEQARATKPENRREA